MFILIFTGISFPKEIMTVNVLFPHKCQAGTKWSRGIFLAILNLMVVAPDTSPSGRKHNTSIYLQAKQFKNIKKKDVELTTVVETTYKWTNKVGNT